MPVGRDARQRLPCHAQMCATPEFCPTVTSPLRKSTRIALFAFPLVVASLAAFFGNSSAAEPVPATVSVPQPWMDASRTPDQRADLLLSAMSQDEQLILVRGYFGANIEFSFTRATPPEVKSFLPGTAGFVFGIPRLGIPPLIESDASVGIANSLHMRSGDTATAFPSTLATAATFDPELAFAVGSAIGSEARARGYNVMLDGSLNLGREPRGGRTFEYAGEDVLLAGTMVGEAVRGIQQRHVISTVKHFAFNDQETGRGILSVNMPEGPMRESDLLAFEIAIEHGHPGAVMCAYNRINGVYSCESDFILDHVLKHDWRYPGWVLSDWGGVHSTVAAVNAGLDQESASKFDGQDYFAGPLKDALAAGKVDPARLRDMVHRILRSMFAIGLFDYPNSKSEPPLAGSAAVARRDAEESMVLLKNANNLLPLSASIRSIAVIGAHADAGMLSGGGSSQVVPVGDGATTEFSSDGPVALSRGARLPTFGRIIYDPPSPLASIKMRAPQASVGFADTSDMAAAVKLAHDSDVAIVFATQWMTENEDVASLSLPRGQDAIIAQIAEANPHTIVVLETGGPVLMPWLDKVSGVLEAWYAGNDGADALADILFGEVDPSGHLPITFPKSEDQLPHPLLPGHDWHSGPFDVTYPEGADVGYRWFERQKAEPLFPFGFGLSYTHFSLSNFDAEPGETITAGVDVTNDGTRGGREMVQLYATPPDGVSRLVAFTDVLLEPGETRHVVLSAEPRLLGHFDTDAQMWRIAKGQYLVGVGASSADIAQSRTVRLPAREMNP